MSGRATRRRERPARTPAWLLGLIGLLIVGGVLVVGYLAGRNEVVPGGGVPFADLKVGECLDIRVEGVPPDKVASDEAVRDATVLGDARRVPCNQPHSHEVAQTTGLDVGDDYRGDDALIRISGPACEAGFADYVGHDLQGSTLGLVIVVPDPVRWQANVRRAVCLIRRNDGQYATATLRHSGS